MKEKLYYMHPVNTYGTGLEKEQLKLISSLFPDWIIINPNQPKHKDAYDALKEETGNGMPYFEELASQCRGGVALPFKDGKIGAGIFKEAVCLAKNSCPVWKLTFNGRLSKLDITDESKKLSVEETRKRIRKEDGSPRDY